MLRTGRVLLLTALLLACLVPIVVSEPDAIDAGLISEAKTKITNAFESVADADTKGGNVTVLVAELNDAIVLLERGEVNGDEGLIHDAILKAEEVTAEAPAIAKQGEKVAQARLVETLLVLGLIAISAVIVWRYGSEIFWDLWVRSRREWRVKAH